MENIRLSPLRPDDAPEMFAGLSDERGYAFIPDEPPETPEKLRERYIMLSSGGTPDGREIWLNLIIRYGDDRRPAGYTQATLTGQEALVAYHVFPSLWRNGIATAAMTLMLNDLFARDTIHTARAFVDTRNAGSVALLKKLGFTLLRKIVNADFFRGAQSDEFEFTLTREAWCTDSDKSLIK